MYEVLSILLKYLEVCAHATWELFMGAWDTDGGERPARGHAAASRGRGWNVRRERGIVNTIVNT